MKLIQRNLLTLACLIAALLLASCSTSAPPTPTESEVSQNATLLLPGHEEPMNVTYEVVEGLAIFEGDIVLGEVDASGKLIKTPYAVDAADEDLDTQGVGRNPENRYRWPNGVVPYVVNDDLSDQLKTRIAGAISHWEAETDLSFVLRTTHRDYVEFVPHSSKCSSSVGRTYYRQVINLKPSCSRGSVIHEIGHAVGLWHEQSRADRDNHVKINEDNIKDGKAGNFKKHVTDGIDIGPYDYGSIMHYGANAFSKNGQPTIETIPAGIAIGQRTGLSDGDIAAANRLYPFVTARRHNWFCIKSEVCEVGDVNGDGRDDLITFLRDSSGTGTSRGDVYVAFSNGNGFGPGIKKHDWFCIKSEVCKVGDVNGDGRADLITFLRDSSGTGVARGDVYVAFSNGNGFGPGIKKHGWFCIKSEICEVGDVNGDGRDDLITFLRDSSGTGTARGDVYVAFSNGTGFGRGVKKHDWFCIKTEVCKVGDMNGDGRADLVTFLRDSSGTGTARGDVYVAYSNGNGFGAGIKKHGWFCIKSEICDIGDMNGDGRDDLVTFLRDSSGTGTARGDVYVAFSKGYAFGQGLKLHDWFCIRSEVCGIGDFNGDGKSDLVTFLRDSSGTGVARGDVYTALSRIATNISRFE